jgi:hypothetical protein
MGPEGNGMRRTSLVGGLRARLLLSAVLLCGCEGRSMRGSSHGLNQDASPVTFDAGEQHDAGVEGIPPQDAAPSQDAPSGPTVVASEEDYPKSLRVDSTHVYWVRWGTSDGYETQFAPRVRRAPKAGGAVEDIAAPVYEPVALALCGDQLFFATVAPDGSGAAWSAPKDGSAEPSVLAGSLSSPRSVACDSTDVWVGCEQSLVRLPRATGQGQVFWVGTAVMAVVADEDALYAGSYETSGTGTGFVGVVARGSSTLETVTTGVHNAGDLALDADSLYVADMCSPPGSIARYSRAAPYERLAYADLPDPGGIAVNDTHVFWTDWSTGVYRTPKGGGAAELVVSDDSGAGGLGALAVDATRVFWSTPGHQRLSSALLP